MAGDVFRALADGTRRTILDVLEDAGLIEVRREGRYRFHDLRTEPLEHLAGRWPDPSGSNER
ncbi:MAG: ArsR/SmtB family transcription factor [Candidatus Limnocylindrales bacterium]